MAIIKFINNQVNLKRTIPYICKKEKTEHKLIYAKDCMIESAYEEMMQVKNMYRKNKGRDKIHFVQSFSPNDNVDCETAHEIGIKLLNKINKFKEFQVVLATHEDRKHIHTHFVVNTVNFNNGKKIQFSKYDVAEIKRISNELCKEYGLSVPREKSNVDDIRINEYKARAKGISWKSELENCIDLSMQKANNKFEFFKYMNNLGYKVTWTKERKNITYTTPNGMKCRDRKLHDEKYLKENMEVYFKEKTRKKFIKGLRKERHTYKGMSYNLAILIEQFKNKENENTQNGAIYGYSESAKKQYAMEMHYSLEEIEDMEM